MRWHSSLYKKMAEQSNGLFYSSEIGLFYPAREWPFLPDANNRLKNNGQYGINIISTERKILYA